MLIGINYTALSCSLKGCIDDSINMRAMLIDAYGYSPSNIIMLRDDDPTRMPTRANMLAALNLMASQSANLSEVVIHYSGHGSQVTLASSNNPGHIDQVIVPCDFPKAGFITDEQLFVILQNFKCRTLLFFDSCNSGSVCDLQYSFLYANNTLSRFSASTKQIPNNPNILMMSGCKDNQTAADTYDRTKAEYVGAFTDVLIECLRNAEHNIDVFALYCNVCTDLTKYGFTQTPILSSSAYLPQYVFVRGGTNAANAATRTTSLAKTLGAVPAPVPVTIAAAAVKNAGKSFLSYTATFVAPMPTIFPAMRPTLPSANMRMFG